MLMNYDMHAFILLIMKEMGSFSIPYTGRHLKNRFYRRLPKQTASSNVNMPYYRWNVMPILVLHLDLIIHSTHFPSRQNSYINSDKKSKKKYSKRSKKWSFNREWFYSVVNSIFYLDWKYLFVWKHLNGNNTSLWLDLSSIFQN